MARKRSPPSRTRSRKRTVLQLKDKAGRVRTKKPRKGAKISDARIERALRVYTETKDIKQAARAIRVAPERLKRAVKRKFPTLKHVTLWVRVRRLPRKMPIFTNGRQLAIKVRTKSASLIGRYMSAVGDFLRTNDPKFLREFKGLSVKDANGKLYPFETAPNTLYRLSSAGGEPFEEMYRIVI